MESGFFRVSAQPEKVIYSRSLGPISAGQLKVEITSKCNINLKSCTFHVFTCGALYMYIGLLESVYYLFKVLHDYIRLKYMGKGCK